MADNVAITAGSGTSIATDEIQVSGTGTLGHVQYVKIVDGTLNGTGAIGGDAANGLDVDVTRLPALVAGSALIGKVGIDQTTPGTTNAVQLTAGTAAIGKLAANSGVDIGDVDVTSVPADPFGANADAASATGSISAKLRFIAATGIPITSAPSTAVTNAGTFAVQADGSIAHDGVDSGNPVKVGMRAIAHGTNPTGVAAADRTDWIASRAGVPFVMGGHPNIITKMQVITTAVTDDSTISGTIASGAKVVVTQVQFTVDNASTVFPKIIIGFGAANTPASGAGVVAAHPGVPAGGGFSRGDGSGILGVGADGEELRVTSVGTIGGNGGYLTVSYYTIES